MNTDNNTKTPLTGAGITTFVMDCDRQVRVGLQQGTIRRVMRTIAADFVSFFSMINYQ